MTPGAAAASELEVLLVVLEKGIARGASRAGACAPGREAGGMQAAWGSLTTFSLLLRDLG